jgi:hypothetical protein
MPQRRPKFGKRREEQLERLPEKLQRKRERRVSSRIRRMPTWIRFALIVTVLIVIVGGWVVLLPRYPEQTVGPTKGSVYFVQTDQFYCSVNSNVTPNGQLLVDYMQSRFAVGTYNGTQPLHVTILDTFTENRNITFNQPFVWDYYGNCYKLSPAIDSRSIRFDVGGIYPALVNKTSFVPVTGGVGDFGTNYWSLYFGYRIDSSNDSLLANDQLSDLFALNFTISVVNGTLVYGKPTIVRCRITLLPPTDGVQYSDGRAYIQFPAKIYNGTDLLANITLQTVEQVGTTTEGTYTSNESLITFNTGFTFLGNDSWGFVFDLNVTAYANSPFCLLNLSSPECQFFIRAGFRNTPLVLDQPMHFPKATVTVHTPYNGLATRNYTEVFLRLPQVWMNTTHVGNSTPLFVPLVVQSSGGQWQAPSFEGFAASPSNTAFQSGRVLTSCGQSVIWAALITLSERLRRPLLV